MATFHPFPRLPAELRTRIWEMSVSPRIVVLHVDNYPGLHPTPRPLRLRSSTPVPAALQACHEARHHLEQFCGYQRVCLSNQGVDLLVVGDSDDKKPERRRQYVWVNLEMDMIDIEDSNMEHFQPVGRLVRRLRLERSIADDYFYHKEKYMLREVFPNVVEIHMVCSDSIETWEGESAQEYWPCARENIYFLDNEPQCEERPMGTEGDSGWRIMRAVDLDDMMDELVRAQSLESDIED